MARGPKILAMVLAGGHGKRLYPLTAMRSKPAVPFAAQYRIIDFVLNNLVNSEIYRIYVLTQFRAQSLTEHIQRHWSLGTFLRDHFIILAPAQMYRFEELGEAWYRGTADAIYQSLHLMENDVPDIMAVFGGDHIFKMDVRHMAQYHMETNADLTIAGFRVPKEEASRFGVLQVDDRWRLAAFQEKPTDPKTIPGRDDTCLISMGNYLFKPGVLRDVLEKDAHDDASSHDFGKDVIPRALREGCHVQIYDFVDNPIPGSDRSNTYWRDVGTLDAYFDASMDLVHVVPEFDLYNKSWPLRAASGFTAPIKFVHESGDRIGRAVNSLLAGGVIVSGGLVRESVLSGGCRVNSYAQVERSVILDSVTIGRSAKVRNAIVDKNVVVPEGARVGWDREEDLSRGFTVTEKGIVVVPKGYSF